jgi:hypothetical protein
MAGPNQTGGESNERKGADKGDYSLDRDHDPLGLDERAVAESEPDDGLVVVPEQKTKRDRQNKRGQAEPPDAPNDPTPQEPPSPRKERRGGAASRSELAEYLHLPDKRFSSPSFFRAVGRVAGGLGVAVFFLSVLAIAWERTWFTGALILFLMFLVGEAAAVILESIGRLERRPPPPPESGEE